MRLESRSPAVVAAPPTTFRLVCGAGQRGVPLVVRVGVGLRPSSGRQLGVSVGRQLLPRPAPGRAPSTVNLQRGVPLPARRRAFKPRPVVRVTYTVRKSASVVALREERVQKAFSVDHHGPGNARLSHRAVGSRRRVKRLCVRSHGVRGPTVRLPSTSRVQRPGARRLWR